MRETTESEQEEQRTVKLEKQNIHVEKRESIIIAHLDRANYMVICQVKMPQWQVKQCLF